MHYSDLERTLLKLESNVVTSMAGFPSAKEIRGSALSRVQGFVLDSSTADRDLPVVIVVGANYTQGAQQTPRDEFRKPAVTGKLAPWKNRFQKFAGHYRNNGQIWYNQCAASSSTILVPEEYHFVMTNFCLWITKRNWLGIPPQVRADLLRNNASFGGKPSISPEWPHLHELSEDIPDALWVGHGLGSEVFTHFRGFVDSREISSWLLMPNVSFRYDYSNPAYLRA